MIGAARDIDRDAKRATIGAAIVIAARPRVFAAATHFLTRKSGAARNDFEILRS
jgi:hypothetical protein